MLDTKSTFDQLVTQYADDEGKPSGSSRTASTGTSRALAGTQEYMAMEKLHELHDEGGFDLIVVDTPPTRHALDFLDAPRRLTRLLDNRIFRLLMTPTRAGLRVASIAVQAFLRTVARVVGTEVIDDSRLLPGFEGMEDGFRQRATAVPGAPPAPSTAFVLVTSPPGTPSPRPQYFADRLAEGALRVNGLVVNRIHPAITARPPTGSAPVGSALRRADTRPMTARRGSPRVREPLRLRRAGAARSAPPRGARTACGSRRDRTRAGPRPDVYDFARCPRSAYLVWPPFPGPERAERASTAPTRGR